APRGGTMTPAPIDVDAPSVTIWAMCSVSARRSISVATAGRSGARPRGPASPGQLGPGQVGRGQVDRGWGARTAEVPVVPQARPAPDVLPVAAGRAGGTRAPIDRRAMPTSTAVRR